MKLIKLLMLMLVCAITVSSASGQANASINLLTLNSGQVNQGGVVDVQVTVGNTGPVSSIGVNKVRAQISIPIAIASALPNAGQTGLPAGWTILSNTGGVITVCNGTDVIPVGQQRQIFIKIQGNTVGGPSTVAGQLGFGPGTAVCTGLGTLSGDLPADNISQSTIQVLPAAACNLSVSASAGTIACNGGTTTLTATPAGAAGSVEYSITGGAPFQLSNIFTVAAGTYTVTAREVATPACSAASALVNIAQPSVISASASVGSLTICNGEATTLTVIASGGTGSLEYSLNGGAFQSGNSFAVSVGTYTVTVRDANLCTTNTNSITVNASPAITASASAGTILCNAGTTTLTVVASG
ncbi:MAG: hypothetical protein SGI83_11695, partial [Bacteroidota bacterium]|nr:hypothetical protein [Bacteroidota bacterium]